MCTLKWYLLFQTIFYILKVILILSRLKFYMQVKINEKFILTRIILFIYNRIMIILYLAFIL